MNAFYKHKAQNISSILIDIKSSIESATCFSLQSAGCTKDPLIDLLESLVDSTHCYYEKIVHLQYKDYYDIDDSFPSTSWHLLTKRNNQVDTKTLHELWTAYNVHIVEIIKTLDSSKLKNKWHSLEDGTQTLKDIIIDYQIYLATSVSQINNLCGLKVEAV